MHLILRWLWKNLENWQERDWNFASETWHISLERKIEQICNSSSIARKRELSVCRGKDERVLVNYTSADAGDPSCGKFPQFSQVYSTCRLVTWNLYSSLTLIRNFISSPNRQVLYPEAVLKSELLFEFELLYRSKTPTYLHTWDSKSVSVQWSGDNYLANSSITKKHKTMSVVCLHYRGWVVQVKLLLSRTHKSLLVLLQEIGQCHVYLHWF